MLDKCGVGGGITGRIRLAHALAERGHRVTAWVNCPREGVIRGVEYRHFSRFTEPRPVRSLRPDRSSDVFIASTSGGDLDLSPLCSISIKAKLKILMVHGAPKPRGVECQAWDYVSAPSQFIREVVVTQWNASPETVFVCPRGVVGEYFAPKWGRLPRRDPYAIAYAGHPSKGLNAAIAVLRLLRERDARFTLRVFGSNRLWGEEEMAVGQEPGVIHYGLVGQRRLARELLACGFCLNLQAREEPFGLVIVESMRAGCLVLASPVGAYPEIIRDGENGFLIEGAHCEPATHERAAEQILDLARRLDHAEGVRRKAAATPLDWSEVAQRWEDHWQRSC